MSNFVDKTGLIEILGKIKTWCNSRFITSIKINGATHSPMDGEVDLGTVTSSGTTITETTVSGWGFTKNTGTYSKPSGGIPASDLAESYYLASNPDGYTSNKGTVTKVNNTAPDANGNVSITIPSDTTVSGWGFTKNTGTYSKPSGGIPKTDLASAVQASLGKADTALQSVDTWTSVAPSDFFELGANTTLSSSAGRVYINTSLRMVRFIVSVTFTPTTQLATRNEGSIFSGIKSAYSAYKPAWFVPCTAFRDGTGSTYPIAAQLGTSGSLGVRYNAAISANTAISIKIGGIYNY